MDLLLIHLMQYFKHAVGEPSLKYLVSGNIRYPKINVNISGKVNLPCLQGQNPSAA